ncbi:energy transducer TonB [uncultured Polaribacter sp.]|uniref:energy transducer TonB n=1 Tax=uncultured Polaribacter sp. TaxID=174711 RepID=UPI0030DBEC2C|tara:strand:- start:386 stop:1117 length:732 start_codon:yes stop_codon:yes gene_type:complete
MEIKKNPKQQLENYSKIFMQIGLVLTLFITYICMEYKTYEIDNTSNLGVVSMVADMKEDIPIVEIQKVEPPKQNDPPPTIEKIKVVEDDLKIEEAVIKSTETDEGQAVIVKTRDIVEVREVEEFVEDIPFVLIEDVPVYPGCKGNNKELKDCFTQKVTEFFGRKFDVNLATELGLAPGKKKLFVVFTINKSGKIVNVKSRGPHPVLEREVGEIIGSLPDMKPGKQRGMPVGVSYSIPITFEVR